GTAYIPKEIFIEDEVEDLDTIVKWLSEKRGSKVVIKVPKRGEKSQLMDMVKTNARDMLEQYGDRFLRIQRENESALKEIQYVLGLEESLNRIEAYDISNIAGVSPVGSMVVFEGGKPKKNDYRRFKIRSVNTPDDYKSMEEII